MPNFEIDLRSDTVTQPCAGMRQAMATAEVGDDVIDIDPTAEILEQRGARELGKEAAIFMPSGVMANQIALRVHCRPGDEFICEAECHIYHYEQGAFAQLSGLVARTVAGRDGILEPSQLDGLVRSPADHSVITRLVCLENTHNRGGGTVQPQDSVQAICDWAHAHGLSTHLDGARLYNAAVASGLSVGQLAAPFDTVAVCYSKGLGAPVGSLLAGPREFIRAARRARKLFGGGMRQIGILAAAALYALDHNIERLSQDHLHAKMLAEAINQTACFQVTSAKIETNMVIFRVDPEIGSANEVVARLAEKGIGALPFGPQLIRFVTHLDVDTPAIEKACQVIKQLQG